ncbi:hypothetical protein Tco_1359840 [Tanacetum coccineum]
MAIMKSGGSNALVNHCLKLGIVTDVVAAVAAGVNLVALYGAISEGSSKDGDDIGSGMGKSGGVPDGRVPDGGGVSDLVWEIMICGGGNGGGAKGSGGDTGNGDDTGSGDSIKGRVRRNLRSVA